MDEPTTTADDDRRLTARDVFCEDPAGLVEAIEQAIGKEQLGESLPSELTGTTSKVLLSQAAKAIDGILGALKIDQLLMGGWMQLDELRTAIQETADDGSSRLVALKRHTIASEHTPRLDLTVNQAPKKLLDLAISLGFTISAAELVVDNGKVTGIELGSLSSKGEMRAADRTILERETDRLDPRRILSTTTDRARTPE